MRYASCSDKFVSEDVPSLLKWLSGGQECVSHASTGMLGAIPASGAPVPLLEPDKLRMMTELEASFPKMEECGIQMGIGVASGCDEVFLTKEADLVEPDRLLPIFFMCDCRSGAPQERFLVNPWDSEGNLVDLDDYPKLKSYFTKNEKRLRNRRVARDHPENWYRTLDRPNGKLSGRSMLLFPDMASSSDPVLSDGSRYPHHNCYWLISSTWDLAALGGLLMSDIATTFVDAYGVKCAARHCAFRRNTFAWFAYLVSKTFRPPWSSASLRLSIAGIGKRQALPPARHIASGGRQHERKG